MFLGNSLKVVVMRLTSINLPVIHGPYYPLFVLLGKLNQVFQHSLSR
jgi:hypothetical protein